MSKQAIFTTNNAWDSIYLTNGTYITVLDNVLKDFISAEIEEDDFSNWNGEGHWLEEAETIQEAVELSGDNIIAYYENNRLIIEDKDKWEERKHFYLGDN